MAHPVKVYNLDDMPQLMGRFLLPTSRPTHGGSLDEEDVDVDLTVSVIVWVSQVFAQGDGAILCFLPVSLQTLLRISLRIYLFVIMVLIFMRVETCSYYRTCTWWGSCIEFVLLATIELFCSEFDGLFRAGTLFLSSETICSKYVRVASWWLFLYIHNYLWVSNEQHLLVRHPA